jgi:N-acetylglucosaminyldiphosphoundecaprenol N-acetyl-beta-D-mannosaminyltransferase
VDLGPLRIFDGDLGLASDLVLARVRLGLGARIATANMDFIAQARHSAQLRSDLANSTLVVADGAPVAWLSRLAGARRTRRVTGVDLVEEICSQASQAEGLRIAFYGSTAELAAKAAAYIEGKYAGVRVVTRITPPFRDPTDAEASMHRETLMLAKPDLVLVALGCPKQERFIAENQHVLPGAAWIGVGGTLDFFAGLRKRAPKRVQGAGLEWLIRLAQDPKRLWKRYLVQDVPALAAVAPGVVAARLRNGSWR